MGAPLMKALKSGFVQGYLISSILLFPINILGKVVFFVGYGVLNMSMYYKPRCPFLILLLNTLHHFGLYIAGIFSPPSLWAS